MVVTWQTIITVAAVVAAVGALIDRYNKMHNWYLKQEKQEENIKAIKEEQQILTVGVLACLKGLKEQGCNGPVTDAIREIEEYLNRKAHE